MNVKMELKFRLIIIFSHVYLNGNTHYISEGGRKSSVLGSEKKSVGHLYCGLFTLHLWKILGRKYARFIKSIN